MILNFYKDNNISPITAVLIVDKYDRRHYNVKVGTIKGGIYTLGVSDIIDDSKVKPYIELTGCKYCLAPIFNKHSKQQAISANGHKLYYVAVDPNGTPNTALLIVDLSSNYSEIKYDMKSKGHEVIGIGKTINEFTEGTIIDVPVVVIRPFGSFTVIATIHGTTVKLVFAIENGAITCTEHKMTPNDEGHTDG